jgi:CheY-like chemotaxis protein
MEGTFSLIAKQKGLQFIVPGSASLPRRIHADAGKLRQVLINLVSNAIKFTSDGSVTLHVSLLTLEDTIERVRFEVIDTGAGIAEEELQRLGEAFYQAQAGRQAKEGTGLGLAICRHFVRLMGGELALSSQQGKGTQIAFDLPLVAAAVSEVESASRNRRVTALAAGQPAYRVLAVDDRAEGRQLLVRLLTPLGFDVREAGNGQEAIELWQAWSPDLIFMDMRMPVMDGREATRQIRAQAHGKRTIIVALTASSYASEREGILADGCDDHLSKPLQEPQLFSLLEQHLGAEFVYAETAAAAAESTRETLTSVAIAALSKALKAELEDALSTLDMAAIDAAIAAIGKESAPLAEALSDMTAQFRYDELLHLLEDR